MPSATVRPSHRSILGHTLADHVRVLGLPVVRPAPTPRTEDTFSGGWVRSPAADSLLLLDALCGHSAP